METVQTETLKAQDRLQDKANASTVVLKGSVFTLPILKLSSTDLDLVEKDLTLKLATTQDFFKNAAVVVDLELTRDLSPEIRFSQLEALLRKQQLIPVGVQNGSLRQNAAAIQSGFAILTSQSMDRSTEVKPPIPEPEPLAATEEVQQPNQELPKATPAVFMSDASKMMRQPVRSGQRVYAKDGDIVLLGAVNAGAEVMADGNIHIYAPLRGRALAGLDGNTESRIFCQCMEAELVAIAGNYRVFEDNIPEEIYKKPVQIYLQGEQLKIDPMI